MKECILNILYWHRNDHTELLANKPCFHIPIAFHISVSGLPYFPGQLASVTAQTPPLSETLPFSSHLKIFSFEISNLYKSYENTNNSCIPQVTNFKHFATYALLVHALSICAPFFPLNYLRVVCDAVPFQFFAEEREPLLQNSEIISGIWGKRKWYTNYSQIVSFLHSFNMSAGHLRAKILFHGTVINFKRFNTDVLLSNFLHIQFCQMSQ